MGQYWKLVNIDQRSALHHQGGLKLWEFIMSSSAEQLVALLQTPNWVDFRIQRNIIAASKNRSHTVQDVTSLSLTCSYFFRLLGTGLQKALAMDLGPWSGDRLVFVGDYADGYPANMGTDEEKLEWDGLGRNPLYELPNKISGEGKRARPRSLYYRAATTPFEAWGELIGQLRESLSGDLETVQRFDRLVPLLMQPAQVSAPKDSAPVLRNLTAKKYVRDEALANSDFAYSLGEVLVTYTQWTEDPSGTEGLGLVGDWVGHRFDINSMASVAGEEWEDLSEDAIERLDMVTGCKKKDGRRA